MARRRALLHTLNGSGLAGGARSALLETGQQSEWHVLRRKALALHGCDRLVAETLKPSSLNGLPTPTQQPSSRRRRVPLHNEGALRHGLKWVFSSALAIWPPYKFCAMRRGHFLARQPGRAIRVKPFFDRLRSRCCWSVSAAAFSSPCGRSRSALLSPFPDDEQEREPSAIAAERSRSAAQPPACTSAPGDRRPACSPNLLAAWTVAGGPGNCGAFRPVSRHPGGSWRPLTKTWPAGALSAWSPADRIVSPRGVSLR